MSGVANTPDEVRRYASCTLLSASMVEAMTPDQSNPKENAVQACVAFLEENEFIRFAVEKSFITFRRKEVFRQLLLFNARDLIRKSHLVVPC